MGTLRVVAGSRLVLALFAVCGAVFASKAATLTLYPAADTTLIQVAPTNNNGGQDFFNAGTTQNNTRNRGLLRFALGSIPTNAQITSASVVLAVMHIPAEPPASAPFGLHRMLRNWGEGTNVAVLNIGQGTPAAMGSATWTHAHFNTNAWATPGGLAGTDYFDFASASQIIYDLGSSPYTFGPTTELATDVQGWLQNPASNFGWMLLCAEEGTTFTARRFGSRENSTPDNRPQLILNYLVPPSVTRAEVSGDNFLLGFQAAAGHSYAVEYRSDLTGGTWQTLVNLGTFDSSTPVIVLDPLAQPQRFYRLRAF